MLIVRDDPEAVEADLSAGLLRCPSCQDGVLARWGFARWRELLDGTTLRPRRAACLAGCGATHVLLPDAVITGGEAYTDTACRLGVPPDTVFEWLRRLRRRAGEIASHFLAWLVALAPGDPLPEPEGRPAAYALELLGAVARLASLRLGARPAWSWASALTGGALLSNTSSPFVAPA